MLACLVILARAARALTDGQILKVSPKTPLCRPSVCGGRRYLPLAFTEHGTIMAASGLNSERAVQMSVYVVRALVQLRAALLDHKALADKLTRAWSGGCHITTMR